MGTQSMCQAALVFDSPIAQLGHGRDDGLLALWPVGGTEQRREGGLRVARLLEILCRVWSKKSERRERRGASDHKNFLSCTNAYLLDLVHEDGELLAVELEAQGSR